MINRDSRGHLYSNDRGEILGPLGNFTVGPAFSVGKDRLWPPSQTQEPGLVL